MNRRIFQIVLAALLCACFASAKGDYEKEIRPVLKERCYACHGALKQRSGLRVDTVRAMLEAEVVVPGNPQESELFRLVSSKGDKERMPPEGHSLTVDQLDSIHAWIANGAPAPANDQPEDDPLEHWAFQKITRPSVPEIEGVKNPVDAFLMAKHRERNLVPQPRADQTLAVRRLYLDLIGLPPTPEQLADQRPWEEIVEELLQSPQHGERWGRHWMDVWRYADWYGLGAQLRYSQKHLWHWRDWIVESLNSDKGYDRMIREMLAGDEIAPEDPDIVRATGFLARNYFLFNRTTWLDSTIEHTSKAFLGLTMNCAKCHDHKYDPIGIKDYYQFRAIFEPHQVRLDPVPGFADLDQGGLPRVFDDHLEATTYIHLRGDPKQPDKETEIMPSVPAFLSGFAQPVREVELPQFAWAPGSRAYAREAMLTQARKKLRDAEAALKKAGEEKSAASKSDFSTFTPIIENFAAFNPEVWKLEGKGLEYRNGALEQVVGTRSPGQLISKQSLPYAFEIICRYTTTGGPTYRSVTFRFDRDDSGRNSNYIYTSEHASGPKVQAAYSRNGKTSYPGDGRSRKQQATGKEQEMRIAVRGTLANVWLDGKYMLAYRFPDRSPGGKFSLSAFDATAVFHHLEIRELADDVSLTEAKNRPAPISGAAKKLAKLKRDSAKLELDSIEATIAADLFRYTNPGKQDKELELKAAKAQALVALAKAEVNLADTDNDKNKKAKKAAEEKLAAAEKGEVKYQPLNVSRKALETPEHKFEDYPAEFSKRSTGRRSMLADWIVSPENPLTARVAVNHVWMRHFGEPLVDSVFDFGRQAKKPLHAGLLDFLASEFVDSGWSFRHLHRLLVTSDAWQRSSSTGGADVATKNADRDNRYYWRANPRRMEAQLVRDSLLLLAGDLDTEMGGPSIDAKSGSKRRSLYFTHSPDKLDTFLSTFDDADLQQCYRRSESVVPQQALALSNSKLSFSSAGKIAEKLGLDTEREEFVRTAFDQILARPAESDEMRECLRFFDDLEKAGTTDRKKVRTQLVHALLNHNDFIAIR